MVDLIDYLANLQFFDIPLLYCYTKFNLSIICCLIYLFLGVSTSLFCNYLECNSVDRSSSECNSFGDFFETRVIFSATLLPIKSPVASAVFELLFLKQFLLHPLYIFSTIKKFLTVFIT